MRNCEAEVTYKPLSGITFGKCTLICSDLAKNTCALWKVKDMGAELDQIQGKCKNQKPLPKP